MYAFVACVMAQGLDHLVFLERLILYGNAITDMTVSTPTAPDRQELYKLRANRALQDVDLRLNAVCTQGGVHYRLLVVHLLPVLRRLDDIDVRDAERGTRLLHALTFSGGS